VVSLTAPSPHDTAMPIPRLLPFAFALLVSGVGGAAAVMAQTPEPAKASPGVVKMPPMGEIVFYVAHGDADACGRGCNEWIVAEGKIDAGAAPRLRRLLAKLGRRRPPIFFHSPGGSVAGSIELGRLIRGQKLAVSVSHTVARGCDRDKLLDKSCDALKRSGQELEADFDPALAMCNSGCVLALAGGAVRFVPPWVKLGIHDIGIESNRTPTRGAVAEAKRVAHARILEYLVDVGIDKSLLTASSAVPNETVRFVEREELVRFGIDRSEFGETVWRFADTPTVAMSKRFFVRTGNGDRLPYRNGFVRLDCGLGHEIRLVLAQQHDSAGLPPVQIDANGHRIDLRSQPSSRDFDMRSGLLSADMLDSIADVASIAISGLDKVPGEGSAGDLKLNMVGFSAAYAKLRKSCDVPERNPVALAPRAEPIVVPSYLGAKYTLAAPEPPKPPQTHELTGVVADEQRLRLDFLYSVASNCFSTGSTKVRILEPPQHGTVENGEAFGDFPCATSRPKGTLVFYEPSSGYTGTDSITLDVIYRPGTTSTRHYSIEVK